MRLALRCDLSAALVLPLYYAADATVTLLRRVVAREPIWQAHRSHFYQRAVDGGFSVSEIVAHVFALNLMLVALAVVAVSAGRLIALVSLLSAAALVSVVLVRFARGKT